MLGQGLLRDVAASLDRDPGYVLGVGVGDMLLHIIMDDAPLPGVVLANLPDRRIDRHGWDHRHDTASNSGVKPLPARAHGAAIFLISQLGQWMRGIRACCHA